MPTGLRAVSRFTPMIGTKTEALKWLVDQADGTYQIRPYKAKRSLTQNGYFHKLVELIATALRSSSTEVKNHLIADGGYIDEDLPHVILPDKVEWAKLTELHLKPTGRTKRLDNGILYQVYFVMRGTHTYNSAEMAHLIDLTVEEAKGLGIETLPPEELKRLREIAERRENASKDKDDQHIT